jgi:UDP-N-acetylmuramyl pentapeptide synthase
VRILDDTYNANPVSVRAALDAFREAPGGGRRWVILGDMLELGTLSEAGVLVKGSRGMRMERAVDTLLAGLGAPRC